MNLGLPVDSVLSPFWPRPECVAGGAASAGALPAFLAVLSTVVSIEQISISGNVLEGLNARSGCPGVLSLTALGGTSGIILLSP